MSFKQDHDGNLYFHGPARMSIYEEAGNITEDSIGTEERYIYRNIPERQRWPEDMRCSIGDHKWPVRAFITVIPNRFNLCIWHYVEYYPDLHRMLKTHYESEPGRDWF